MNHTQDHNCPDIQKPKSLAKIPANSMSLPCIVVEADYVTPSAFNYNEIKILENNLRGLFLKIFWCGLNQSSLIFLVKPSSACRWAIV